MKPSYKKDLALVKVKNLTHLIKLCIKIDAEDQNLKKRNSGIVKKSVNYLLPQSKTEQEEISDRFQQLALADSFQVTGEQNVHAIFPIRNSMAQLRPNQQANLSHPILQSTHTYQGRISCWNCKQAGHLWNVCPAQKTIFCHLCGNPGKTANTCENHLAFNQMSQTALPPNRLADSRSQSQPNLTFSRSNLVHQARPFLQSKANLSQPTMQSTSRFPRPANIGPSQRVEARRNVQVLEFCEPESGIQYVAYPVNQLDYSGSVPYVESSGDDEDKDFHLPSSQKN